MSQDQKLEGSETLLGGSLVVAVGPVLADQHGVADGISIAVATSRPIRPADHQLPLGLDRVGDLLEATGFSVGRDPTQSLASRPKREVDISRRVEGLTPGQQMLNQGQGGYEHLIRPMG